MTVTAYFRPEAELFLRMRTKGIVKSLGRCMLVEEFFPLLYEGTVYWTGAPN